MAKSKKGLVPFGIIFALCGLGSCVYGVYLILEAKKSEAWVSCPAVIEHSEATVPPRTDKTKRRRKVKWIADIQYRYVVEGKEYMGDKVSYGTVRMRQGPAEKIVARYPVGSETKVFYNPENHAEVVLEPGIHHSQFTFIYAGGIFMVVGVWVAWRYRKR